MHRSLGPVGAVIIALLVAALACSVKFSTAHIKHAGLYADPDGDQTARSYAPEDTFYARVELTEASGDTRIKAVWKVVEGVNVEPDTALHESEIESGSGLLLFEAAPPDDAWPVGAYRLDLYLDGEHERSLDFRVESSARFTAAGMVTAASSADRAIAYATTEPFYCVAELANAPENTLITAVWSTLDEEGESAQTLHTEDRETGSGSLRFELPPPEDGWPLGKYHVELQLNGTVARTVKFDVRPPEIRLTRLALDAAGENRATAYAVQDTFYALADLATAPPATQITAMWSAVDVEGREPGILHEESLQTGTGSLVFELLPPEDGWPLGDYQVEWRLNGDPVKTLDFTVSPPGIASAVLVDNRLDQEEIEDYGPTDAFYGIVRLVAAPPDTAITAVWVAEDAAGLEPETVLHEDARQSGTGTLVFELPLREAAWHAGVYRLDLILDGDTAESIPFTVTSPATITRVAMTADAEGDSVSTYGPADVFFCAVELASAPPTTQITAIWTAVEADTLHKETQQGGSGTLIFDLPPPEEGWDAGPYRVDLYLNGEQAKTITFSVE